MLGAGDRTPNAEVWLDTSSDPVAVASLLAGAPRLIFFYLYDWSST